MGDNVKAIVLEIDVDSKSGEVRLKRFGEQVFESGRKVKQGADQGTKALKGMGDAVSQLSPAAGRVLGPLTAFQRVLGSLKPTAAALGPAFGNAGTAMAALVPVAFGVAAALGGIFVAWKALSTIIHDAIPESEKQVKAEADLASALVARGQAQREVFDSLVNGASKLQDYLGISDDVAIQQEALAIRLGVTADQAERLVQVSGDIAAVWDKDLKQVDEALARSIATGTNRAMKQLGIDMDETILKSRDTAKILDALSGQFAGAASARIQTFSGQLGRATNAWSELLESIGDYIVRSPSVIAATKGLADMLGILSGETKGSTDVLRPFVLAIVDVGIVALTTVDAVWELNKPFVRLAWTIAQVPITKFMQDLALLDKLAGKVAPADPKDGLVSSLLATLQQTRKAILESSGQLAGPNLTGKPTAPPLQEDLSTNPFKSILQAKKDLAELAVQWAGFKKATEASSLLPEEKLETLKAGRELVSDMAKKFLDAGLSADTINAALDKVDAGLSVIAGKLDTAKLVPEIQGLTDMVGAVEDVVFSFDTLQQMFTEGMIAEGAYMDAAAKLAERIRDLQAAGVALPDALTSWAAGFASGTQNLNQFAEAVAAFPDVGASMVAELLKMQGATKEWSEGMTAAYMAVSAASGLLSVVDSNNNRLAKGTAAIAQAKQLGASGSGGNAGAGASAGGSSGSAGGAAPFAPRYEPYLDNRAPIQRTSTGVGTGMYDETGTGIQPSNRLLPPGTHIGELTIIERVNAMDAASFRDIVLRPGYRRALHEAFFLEQG